VGGARRPREHRAGERLTTDATADSTVGPAAPGQYWWLPFAAGVLTIIAGLIALIWPGPTLLVVGVVLGAYLMVWGVITLVRGIGGAAGMHPGLRLALVLLGLFAVLAALFLLVRPAESVLAVAWVIGFWWILSGEVELTRGFVIPEGRAWNIGLGLIGIVAGTVILAQPQIGLAALVVISGIGLICQGAIEAIAGWQLRYLHKEGLA
jgi:uncharacterized membrane protein HdeD (DUF308 family)